MKVLSRLLFFTLIFQLLALSSLPPAGGIVLKEQNRLRGWKQAVLTDGSGILGQFTGFNKDEQNEITEDESEDFDDLSDCANYVGITLSVFSGVFLKTVLSSGIPVPVISRALFILFHCWKVDFLIG